MQTVLLALISGLLMAIAMLLVSILEKMGEASPNRFLEIGWPLIVTTIAGFIFFAIAWGINALAVVANVTL
jgi:hypothetical protein